MSYCIELPKDHKLKVTGRGLSQKVDVLLTIEEQFCNVLKIIVKVVKKGLNCSPTIVIPTDKLVQYICTDTHIPHLC